MILNLTEAEWGALIDAALLQDVTWEQDGDDALSGGAALASGARKRKALHRAMRKAGQLAPEGTFRWKEEER